MHPLTAEEIRASFVNCSKGEAKRASMPPDLDAMPWDSLDYLGWADPAGSARAYLVAPHPGEDGELVGMLVRQTSPQDRTAKRSALCQICVTPHNGGGVALTTATKAGAAGKRGDSAGLYICRDLACSLYVRGARVSGAPRLRETLPVERQVERLRANLDEFIARVLRSA